MKRKLLFLLCAVLVIAVAMTACGKKSNEISDMKIVEGTMDLNYLVG